MTQNFADGHVPVVDFVLLILIPHFLLLTLICHDIWVHFLWHM